MKQRALALILGAVAGLGIVGGCGEEDEQRPAEFRPPTAEGCPSYNQATCEDDATCEPIEASGIRNGARSFVGCQDAGTSCDDAVGCAYPTKFDGACRYFYSTCIPDGWVWDGDCSSDKCDVFAVGEGGAGGADAGGGAGGAN